MSLYFESPPPLQMTTYPSHFGQSSAAAAAALSNHSAMASYLKSGGSAAAYHPMSAGLTALGMSHGLDSLNYGHGGKKRTQAILYNFVTYRQTDQTDAFFI